MPGSSIVGTGPPDLSPSAGLWPLVPGRYRMLRPTRRPPTASSGSGHHIGAALKPSCLGAVVKNQV